MKKTTPGLRIALKQCMTERPVHRWLERNPLVLSHVVKRFAFPDHVLSQFKFGTDFIADFVTLGSFSGGCCVHFIELEPPGCPLFTKKGVPARRLNEALSQLRAWKIFLEKQRDVVLRELAKEFQRRELVFGPSKYEPTDNGGTSIYDPKVWIHWHFHIVIGRRATLSKSDLERKASYLSYDGIEVMTHDRILDEAIVADDLEAQREARFQAAGLKP